MGLLNRNNSGRTYDGKESSRKGFIDRVKWDMEEDQLVYKFPYDNLTTGTRLFVHESQRAFLFKNGALFDSFGPEDSAGGIQLSTGNIPFLQRVLNLPTGGETAFTAEVWFVNTELVKRNMPWGSGGMRIMDPYFNIPVKLGARGQYGFKVTDPVVFLKKAVGTMHSITNETVYDMFRTDVIEGMKVHLFSYMKNNKLNVNELGGEYIKIAGFIKQELEPHFTEFGISLLNFNIEDIVIDENDPGYQKVMDKIASGIGDKHMLDTLGDQYAQVRQLEIMEKAAQNEGMAGGMMGAGLGFGMGNMMGSMMGNMSPQQNQAPQAAPAPAPASAPAPPPPAAAEIFLTSNGQTMGPYSVQQFGDFLRENRVNKDSLVWKNGLPGWIPASTLPELQQLFSGPATPPPPPPPTF